MTVMISLTHNASKSNLALPPDTITSGKTADLIVDS